MCTELFQIFRNLCYSYVLIKVAKLVSRLVDSMIWYGMDSHLLPCLFVMYQYKEMEGDKEKDGEREGGKGESEGGETY